jgi:hypothetical protein
MKTSVWIAMLTGLGLLSGCAHNPEVSREAQSVDLEWGQAQERTWAQQVAYPEGRSPEKLPEGMEGNTAEEVMGVYNQSFAERPTRTQVFQLGIVSGK